MRNEVAAWVKRLRPDITLDELERFTAACVAAHFAERRATLGRDDPGFGRACYTVFNLNRPILRWLRIETRSKDEALAALRLEILRYLKRPSFIVSRRRPIPVPGIKKWCQHHL